MGKIDEKKQQKLDALLNSAYDLFIRQGIENTSISDIVKKAGVAKGTFYLYFKDKYEICERLISQTASSLFIAAYNAMDQASPSSFEDKIIYIMDYVLNFMVENKHILRFISKNLSWGIFKQAIIEGSTESNTDAFTLYKKFISENADVTLRAPDTLLFLIIELASSASFSTILENDPIPFDELLPDLNESIRAIVRNHIVK